MILGDARFSQIISSMPLSVGNAVCHVKRDRDARSQLGKQTASPKMRREKSMILSQKTALLDVATAIRY